MTTPFLRVINIHTWRFSLTLSQSKDLEAMGSYSYSFSASCFSFWISASFVTFYCKTFYWTNFLVLSTFFYMLSTWCASSVSIVFFASIESSNSSSSFSSYSISVLSAVKWVISDSIFLNSYWTCALSPMFGWSLTFCISFSISFLRSDMCTLMFNTLEIPSYLPRLPCWALRSPYSISFLTLLNKWIPLALKWIACASCTSKLPQHSKNAYFIKSYIFLEIL